MPRRNPGPSYDLSMVQLNLIAMVKNNPICLVDKDGRLSEYRQIYGNWCGWGWTGGRRQDAIDYNWTIDPRPSVFDSLDLACRFHDACYARRYWAGPPWGWGFDDTRSLSWCDHELCDSARASVVQGAEARRARSQIICWFCSFRFIIPVP